MCGICGIIAKQGQLNELSLKALNETMYNRGPDGSGAYWENGVGIAMRRLSIIDLEGGWQPIFSENKQIVVVQNGEIYNFQQLRKELEVKGHRFKTHSDTEVLVHGYEEWGAKGLLQRIDGMYAFAIWDKAANKMILARDRFGEKPLYYHAAQGLFIFSSQMLTVAAALKSRPTLDSTALYLYLGLHFVPGDQTIFSEIRKLLPGEMCEINLTDASFHCSRYWEILEGPERSMSPDEMGELLKESVRSRLIADVPVGIFLSGGLDSSIIAYLACQQQSDIQTFSMGFSGEHVDESVYSKMVADFLGTKHHHFTFELNDFKKYLPAIIATMDEPVGDQALLPVYWLCSEAAKHVKVVLSGEGADELFAGYGYYQNKAVSPSMRYRLRCLWYKFQNRDLWQGGLFEPTAETPSGFPLLTNEGERLALIRSTSQPNLGRWWDMLASKLAKTTDPLRRACICEIETWLAEDLLMKYDKMAMANSLEGRAPFLNPAVAQAALNLPLDQRIKSGVGKVILRDYIKGKLPDDIILRRKQGFVLPMKEWLAKDLKEDLLESARLLPPEIIDQKELHQILVNDLNQGVNRERLLYAIYVLSKWVGNSYSELSGKEVPGK